VVAYEVSKKLLYRWKRIDKRSADLELLKDNCKRLKDDIRINEDFMRYTYEMNQTKKQCCLLHRWLEKE